MDASKDRVTLKALASFSPGFALKPWVQKCPRRLPATLEGLRGFWVNERLRTSFFRVAPSRNELHLPRVAKAQPWAGIGERFQRYLFSNQSCQKWVAFRLFVQRQRCPYPGLSDGCCIRKILIVAILPTPVIRSVPAPDFTQAQVASSLHPARLAFNNKRTKRHL